MGCSPVEADRVSLQTQDGDVIVGLHDEAGELLCYLRISADSPDGLPLLLQDLEEFGEIARREAARDRLRLVQ